MRKLLLLFTFFLGIGILMAGPGDDQFYPGMKDQNYWVMTYNPGDAMKCDDWVVKYGWQIEPTGAIGITYAWQDNDRNWKSAFKPQGTPSAHQEEVITGGTGPYCQAIWADNPTNDYVWIIMHTWIWAVNEPYSCYYHEYTILDEHRIPPGGHYYGYACSEEGPPCHCQTIPPD